MAQELSMEDIFGADEDNLYKIIIEATECGPFDGGCVFVADALLEATGGELMVLTFNGQAEHACVFYDGLYYDFDGAKEKDEFIKNFKEQELSYRPEVNSYSAFDIRPFIDGDLPEAPRNAELSSHMSSIIFNALISEDVIERPKRR